MTGHAEKHGMTPVYAAEIQRLIEFEFDAGGESPLILTCVDGNILRLNNTAREVFGDVDRRATTLPIWTIFPTEHESLLRRMVDSAGGLDSSEQRALTLASSAGAGGTSLLITRMTLSPTISYLRWRVQSAEFSGCLFPDETAWLRFLNGATFAFSGSLQVDATVRSIVNQAVPSMSDWCTLDLLESGEQYLRRVSVANSDRQRARSVKAIRRRYPVTDIGTHPVLKVLQTGEPALIPEFTDAFLRETSKDEQHFAFIKGLGLRSSMIFPLKVAGDVIGALTFASAESGRTYTSNDLLLAAQYVDRAAQALGNARRYEHAEQVSRIREHYLMVASHEIRTPLAVIGGFASLLARQIRLANPDLTRVDALTVELQQGVERLEALTEDLLVASSLQRSSESTSHEEIDLVELARHVIKRLAVTAPHVSADQIVLRGEESVLGFWNAGLLEQALSNLVGNAIKYSPDLIRITITITMVDNDTVSIDVEDAGMGISEEDQELLFLPFSRGSSARRMSDGTGLGLYITSQIVEQHQGTIDVNSAVGRGSTFSIKLPLRNSPLKRSATA